MFRHVFARWGRPDAIRVDNGYPWGTPRDLPTELALWLIGLSVGVAWNRAARPQDNGRVERDQGVANAWAEPQTCAAPASLIDRLDWTCRTQTWDYPSIHGQPRVVAYPQLLVARRAYTPEQESAVWDLGRVDQWLSQRSWVRRVGRNGVISMYGHRRSLGRKYAGGEVVVRFEPASRCWVVSAPGGEEWARFLAWELSQARIVGLAVGRKRCQRQKS